MTGSLVSRRGPADLIAVGFGTTVAMWAIAYTMRLLELRVQSAAAVFTLLCLATMLLLGCHFVAGAVVGRRTPRGTVGGVWAGLITGALNLLAVASAFGGDQPNQVRPSAPLWIVGTLGIAVALTTLGAALGSRGQQTTPARRQCHNYAGRDHSGDSCVQSDLLDAAPDWDGGFAAVAACATFMLLMIGGLVTGLDEGLAVVDWPNTETYNMFLYPLSRMTGGIFLEHAHRLFGSLVGLTTLVLTIQILATDRRRAVRPLAIAALFGVAVQGALGGLRVTGRFTFSANPTDTQPSVVLAIVHGVFGQMVFGALVALALARSRAWRRGRPRPVAPSAGIDRLLAMVLAGLLLAQLGMGALVRHFSWALYKLRFELSADPAHLVAVGHWALIIHVTLAVLVTVAAVAAGVRAWGLYERLAPVRRCGAWLLLLIATQLTLGILALVVTGNDAPDNPPGLPDALVTTAHQALGAALLALAVLLLLWSWRLHTSNAVPDDLSTNAIPVAAGADAVSAGTARDL